jgi:hypothetical protein
LGCALDADANIAYFYKNGTLAYTYNFSSHLAVGSGNLTPHAWNGSSGTPVWTYNFGQRAWTHTPRTNHKALCTANLPAPLVTKPSTVMDVKLWTGNGSTQTISGLGFEPDMVWLKRRSATANNRIYDQIRGAQWSLVTDLTNAEENETTGLTAFTSTGFSLGDQAGHNSLNGTFVGWCWDAGASTVTNTQGSITSQVRANASAGFSVATLTTPGSGTFTVGHGLNVAPSLVICKARNQTFTWIVYHRSAGAGNYLVLNTTAASAANATIWQNTNPSSTLVYGDVTNWGTANYVMYSFAPVNSYSAFGSYTGNGSSDGPFVFTGMRPRWLLVKRTSSTGNWNLFDTSRSDSNLVNKYLLPNDSGAEFTFSFGDILSNGFKLRDTSADWNASGATYVYAAFAEAPLNYARAR